MLMIDVSESLGFGSRKILKRDMVAEIAATLAFSAIQNNDKIGVIFLPIKLEIYPSTKRKKTYSFYYT